MTVATALLAAFPAAAQKTPAVIGQVVNSTSATLNGAPLPGGVTIFDGDVVATGASGEAVVKLLPNNEVVLNEKTSAIFSKVLDQTRLELQRGTLVVKQSGTASVVVATPRFEIQPSHAGNAKLYVGLMADKSTYIESAQGEAVIVDTRSGNSYLLPAGQNTLVPESASSPPGLQPRQKVQTAASKPAPAMPSTRPRVPRRPSSRNSHLAIGLGIAAGAAGGVAALVATSSGSSARSVSPANP
jgi:hypothetical protein